MTDLNTLPSSIRKLIQKGLQGYDLYSGSIDGIIGPMSKLGIASFEKSHPDAAVAPAPSVITSTQVYRERIFDTPNKTASGNAHTHLVLHHTEGWSKTGDPESGDLSVCLNPQSKVSYHCIVAWNGERSIMAPDSAKAWHAGVSQWDGKRNCNDFTLGLAFGGDTNTGAMRPLGSKILNAHELISALEWIIPRAKKYGWKSENIITHQMIAPNRKTDTSREVLLQVREAFERAMKHQ